MNSLDKILDLKTENEIIPALMDFIRIPSVSPIFDPEWKSKGLIEQCLQLVINYLTHLQIDGFSYEVFRIPEAAPLLLAEIPPNSDKSHTILFYAHLDKQPPMDGWNAYNPELKDGQLYGRGAADDGYAILSVGSIVKTLQELQIPHGRIIIVGENEEESESKNLKDYLVKISARVNTVDLVVCLDTGTVHPNFFALTSSLRGSIDFKLSVDSPSAFRTTNYLISRLEDIHTGEVKLPEFYTDIPYDEYTSLAQLTSVFGPILKLSQNFLPGVECQVEKDNTQQAIWNLWKPSLTVIGIEGMPGLSTSRHDPVRHLETAVSIRIPPNIDSSKASRALVKTLTSDLPPGTKVKVEISSIDEGWAMKQLPAEFNLLIQQVAFKAFGYPGLKYGIGASVPFMSKVSDAFPDALVLATGAALIDSNVHGPFENLNIDYFKKFLKALAFLISNF